MSAVIQASAETAQPRAGNRGRFQKGPDPRRHKFTAEECSAGFWAAVDSIIARYPDAIMKDGRHMVVNFMKSRGARKVVN